ncbi:N utilization substance protein [Synechocystis sp. PCC 6803]|uniref:Transcription termination/antitermination protein NusA n=1 Tax=Synechocystis sp. (strain ATCC 27184 / PCC 6803 / Kazusa) TaxID=1111708 RepID=P72688_SYNY3|nr:MULTISPECIES: transcription termination factor NusA [unclassified Synechocystis]BAM50397.1 transcription elongation factor NusA [Synechocystis sp. PCC 6803] [Bacillus subtilis BEST7613]AGF50384.1 N utilization substance protein [Synechocystis sp. PCC 6803]ALJ66474.1 transcription elongation factor NusA [Synechocystis sp. PCC 6803]AVP91172.1 transcription termination/antitermination protein NusA [Synechocystis sp. IPPAS B-1465]MBD2616980.1 transcription termination factor NusA [Synechocystis
MSLVSLPGLPAMISEISKRNNLPTTAVEEALREALLKGYERFRRSQLMGHQFPEEYFNNFEVELDTEEEGFRVLSTKRIVEEVENSDQQISLKEVLEVAEEAQLGDEVVLDVTPEQKDFGRMAAIQTKQVLLQKLRDQQRKIIQEEFQDLEGTVLNARALRFERQSIIVAVQSSFGQPEVEAELPKREQLPNDNYRANSTFRVYLKRVREGSQRGPQLVVSRAAAGLVVDLFSVEVPEIEEEVVRIVAVAREAKPPSPSVGPRTKIAVDTLERDVDPVGACIGARGSRIHAVVNELRGEKIDVIRWSPDPATYIAQALSPARVDQVYLIHAEERHALVIVAEDQLSLAIGKEGQNVRLAARLTGWKIDIKDPETYARDKEAIEQSILERAAASAQARAEREAAEQEAQAKLEAEMAALEAEEAEELEETPEAIAEVEEEVEEWDQDQGPELGEEEELS